MFCHFSGWYQRVVVGHHILNHKLAFKEVAEEYNLLVQGHVRVPGLYRTPIFYLLGVVLVRREHIRLVYACVGRAGGATPNKVKLPKIG